ncbi:MAG: hypothetical protein ACRDFT_06570, partial [bacterium]
LKLVISGGIVSPAGARVGAEWRDEPEHRPVRPELPSGPERAQRVEGPREPGISEPSGQEGAP